MDFGTKVKSLRKAQGLSQEQMAAKLCVSRQAVSNWENNKNLPDLQIIIRMSQIFSVSLDELILGEHSEMTNMTEKLISDGSETAKLKTALKILRVGAVLMCIGLLCFFLKSISVEYIDSEGILHENFFYLPIGFLFLFSGAAAALTGAVRAFLAGRRMKKKP